MKVPLGTLICGSFNGTMEKLAELTEKENPPKVISVGDVVSENMTKHKISAHVLIVDNKVMRASVPPISVKTNQTFYVKNSPGTLSDEAWLAVKKAVNQTQQTKVVVEGEEDLLALVAILCAPTGSFVVYGQPHEGIVVVKVTEEKKRGVREIVEGMKLICSKG
ncbi:MAG: GTP-dependent dephospho-CoA kinase family protein [Thermoproteota archaeon]|nr:GTP-dependent dephospho-CoA kinase family protein [Thermoproteota archaeon]